MKNKPTDVFLSIDMKNGDRSQCWPWKGAINQSDGRPYFSVNGRRRTAYALVLELVYGAPQGRQVARHKCDNPVCCNPNHLQWGSQQDNLDDMKKRQRHGLPKIVVRAIKRLLMKGTTHAEIAERYGISREAVTGINNELTHQSKENQYDKTDS